MNILSAVGTIHRIFNLVSQRQTKLILNIRSLCRFKFLPHTDPVFLATLTGCIPFLWKPASCGSFSTSSEDQTGIIKCISVRGEDLVKQLGANLGAAGSRKGGRRGHREGKDLESWPDS